ncbi:protein-L-isoaspartate O-methyltransferase [Lewinellaceae bacterium SD302]|nr:protein-L-isoaspartate O-methyltransferase [Lewinellaceae bacterium SD302]
MEDNFRHRGLRKKLIDQLRDDPRNFDSSVLDAMNRLPRHGFLNSAFTEIAYQDKAFPIACEQTISQPGTVAWQSTLLDIRKRQKVLEIGTGSGYQAAVLALLGGRVFTLERHPKLFEQAKSRFKQLRLGSVRSFLRDGYGGYPEMAPYDRILVTCGAPTMPNELLQQLKIGGRAVIPVGPEEQQRMMSVGRKSETAFVSIDHGPCAFVPFSKGVG